MAKTSEVPVDLQDLEEEEEKVESLDLRQIRTVSEPHREEAADLQAAEAR